MRISKHWITIRVTSGPWKIKTLQSLPPIVTGGRAEIFIGGWKTTYKYHEYTPVMGTNLNTPVKLEFPLELKIYLVFKGKLVKDANDAIDVNNDVVTLTNNAVMFLFINIKCQLSGRGIESLFHCSQATTKLRLLKYPDCFQNSQDLI